MHKLMKSQPPKGIVLCKAQQDDGYAFVTVLFVMVVILIMAGTVLLSAHIQYRMVRRDIHRTEAIYLAEAGLYSAMAEMSTQSTFVEKKMYEFKNSGRVEASVSPWGGYWAARTKAYYHKASAAVEALLGTSISSTWHPALILSKREYPLVVAGDTRIKGDVVVGAAGVRAGIMQGRHFSGTRMIEGDIIANKNYHQSLADFSSLHSELERLRSFLINPNRLTSVLSSVEGSRSMKDSACVYFDVETAQLFPNQARTRQPTGDSAVKDNVGLVTDDRRYVPATVNDKSGLEPFHHTGCRACTVIVMGSLVIESDIALGPWSILVAGKSIRIDHALLDRVLCFAPEIVIGSHCAGNAQLLATKSVQLESGAKLDWPSLIYLQTSAENPGRIDLQANSHVTGSIIMNAVAGSEAKENIIRIKDGAQVTGLVYSNGYVDLAGIVKGCVCAEGFILFAAPTYYYNWLYDAIIDRTALNQKFCLPVGFGEGIAQQPAIWQL